MRAGEISADEIRRRLDVELKLAARLREAPGKDRGPLYQSCYAQYFAEFPNYDVSPEGHKIVASYEAAFVRPFLRRDDVVAEIGPGRGYLAFQIAPHVREVIGIDVADALSTTDPRPANFRLTISDGVHLPLADSSVDLVVSNQLMEHVHPDDAKDQLMEIWRVLRPGGRYVCVTPNRLNGPHDDSRYADNLPVVDGSFIATGFHLKEYTNAELAALFRAAGFRRIRAYAGARGRYVPLPPGAVALFERAIRLIPLRRRSGSDLVRLFVGNRVVACKS